MDRKHTHGLPLYLSHITTGTPVALSAGVLRCSNIYSNNNKASSSSLPFLLPFAPRKTLLYHRPVNDCFVAVTSSGCHAAMPTTTTTTTTSTAQHSKA